LERTI
jgi:hypothetical protein